MFNFFEKVNKEELEMVNSPLLKMGGSLYIVILIEAEKGLELVSSLLVVITTAQFHSTKPKLSSAQVQTLLAACRRFAM